IGYGVGPGGRRRGDPDPQDPVHGLAPAPLPRGRTARPFRGQSMIPSNLASATKLTGRVVAECRDGEGNLVWREDVSNGVTTEGRNHLLDVGFHGASQAGAWYLGLIDADGYTGVDGGDTLASHDGWAEFTDYSGNRPEWTEGAASDGTIANASSVTYAFSGTGAIKGAFI